MNRPLVLALLSFTALAIGAANPQESPEADPEEMPRIPATEPEKARETFEIRPGFRLELAAHEPLVVDPIDLAFDEHGRLFVVEMRGYSEHREDALGRVKLLVDEDDDGTFDSATIYADGLKWPTSVCCYDGGIFVTASPDILYFKDTDEDGVSDDQETVFTGFGLGVSRLNMQALLNSLTWGPDNRIWGATARNGGTVRRPDQPEDEAVNLRGADFSFDPATRELRPENGTAQFGLSFDTRGRRFVCSNSNHLQWVAWERGDVVVNPYHSMPAPLVSIADDGAAAPVYRISPDEPWRIVRTRWRVSGVVKGVVEGGGRVSGYFTAATGVTIQTGDAYGREFIDNAFIGDAGSNLVHRKQLDQRPGRLQPVGTRPEDESETEFLRSRDNWFRPVNFENGPDGCLYVCDMYRETIEHPWSIPEGIKKYVDLDSGNDRGRIWRIVPENFERPAFSLERDNHWQAVTRARLAYEEGETPLTEKVESNRLEGNSVDESDPWRIAFRLNALNTPEALASAWQQSKEAPASLRREAALMIGRTGDPETIELVLNDVAEAEISTETTALVSALGEGVAKARLTLAKIDSANRLAPVFASARALAADSSSPAAARESAIALLGFDDGAEATATLLAIALDPEAADAYRQSALRIVSRRTPAAAERLIDTWEHLSPALRQTAFDVFASSPRLAQVLLEAIREESLPISAVPANTVALLRDHRDAGIKALAAELLPSPAVVDRGKVVERYQAALKLKGDPTRGKQAFIKGTCITCHRTPDGQGLSVGPDLATFKTAGADSLLKNVFDPNAEVAPQYQAFTFDLHSGETMMGLIAREDASEVTLTIPGGQERTFPRKDVASMKGLGRSLMPEGLEATLSPQDVADLLAYIASVE